MRRGNARRRSPAGAPAAGFSSPPAKERLRARHRGLIGLAEVPEGGERLLRILALAQQVGIEAAALHVEKQVARDLPYRAQLAPVAVALAQQARDRIAAPVAELREIHLDARHAV